jgi:hypothetical protein
MLYHGPVRVPADAIPGKAILRLELTQPSSEFVAADEIEVELIP